MKLDYGKTIKQIILQDIRTGGKVSDKIDKLQQLCEIDEMARIVSKDIFNNGENKVSLLSLLPSWQMLASGF